MKRSICMMVALLACAALVAHAKHPKDPWSLFGNATAVKAGEKPNKWAVELVSPSYLETPDFFAGVDYTPEEGTTFADIHHLSTSYNTPDGFAVGSPRFQVNLDTDGDGNVDGNLFIYLGTPPSFNDGPTDGWENTGNLIGDTGNRYDASQIVPGTQSIDYEDALALVGDAEVLGIQLVIDGGYAFEDGEQVVLVDNVQVNNDKLKVNGSSKK